MLRYQEPVFENLIMPESTSDNWVPGGKNFRPLMSVEMDFRFGNAEGRRLQVLSAPILNREVYGFEYCEYAVWSAMLF